MTSFSHPGTRNFEYTSFVKKFLVSIGTFHSRKNYKTIDFLIFYFKRITTDVHCQEFLLKFAINKYALKRFVLYTRFSKRDFSN